MNKGRKKMGRPRHEIWEQFKITGKSRSTGHHAAECKYCGMRFSRGKPLELCKHILTDCERVGTEVKVKLMAGTSSFKECEPSRPTNLTKSPILHHIRPTYMTNDRIKNLHSYMLQFFVECNIPFSVANNFFFRKLITELRPGFPITKFSDTFLFQELATISEQINKELAQEQYLTLAVEGWTDVSGNSIYAFLLLTKDRKIVIHSIQDLSRESHTSQFLAGKIEEVMKEVGPQKIVALVTDNAADMIGARSVICKKYCHLLNLRCIPHFLNLVTKDILMSSKGKSVLLRAQEIVKEFKNSHQKLAALQDVQKVHGVTQVLKKFVPTRLHSVADCLISLLANKTVLHTVAKGGRVKLHNAVQRAILSRNFWSDAEMLLRLVTPISKTIASLESNTATLAETYIHFVSLAKVIEDIEDSELGTHCKVVYGLRWNAVDDDIYRLACFLHPEFREVGAAHSHFQEILTCAVRLWKSFGNGKATSVKLATQLVKYRLRQDPYTLQLSRGLSPFLWWSVVEDTSGNELQQLALRLLAVAPHCASCERIFSVFSWINSHPNGLSPEKLQAIAKLNVFYRSRVPDVSTDAESVLVCDDDSSESEDEDAELPTLDQPAAVSDTDEALGYFKSVRFVQNLDDPMFDIGNSVADDTEFELQVAANVEACATHEEPANVEVSAMNQDADRTFTVADVVSMFDIEMGNSMVTYVTFE